MPEHTKQKPWTQTVTTNKTKVETFFVTLAAMWIIAICATVTYFNQVSQVDAKHLSKNEVSLRYDLKPSEQGVFSDLLLVYQDWLAMDETEKAPDIAALIEDDWPPFTDVILRKNRGSHLWEKNNEGDSVYYLGVSQDSKLSGHFLWVMPKSNKGLITKDFTVWIYQGNGKPPKIDQLHDDDLALAGWKIINPAAEVHRH